TVSALIPRGVPVRVVNPGDPAHTIVMLTYPGSLGPIPGDVEEPFPSNVPPTGNVPVDPASQMSAVNGCPLGNGLRSSGNGCSWLRSCSAVKCVPFVPT